jgi:hypothetical protein
LRVGDEEESMGVCAGFLDAESALHTCRKSREASAYPVLPLVPMAAFYSGIEHASFPPVQHYPPE